MGGWEMVLKTIDWAGTAKSRLCAVRSKTENGHFITFPMLLLAVQEAVSTHTKTRSRSAVQSIFSVAPCCPRGNLVPYKIEENQFHPVLALLWTGAPILPCITWLYSLLFLYWLQCDIRLITGIHVLLTHIDPTTDPRDTWHKGSFHVTELANLTNDEV